MVILPEKIESKVAVPFKSVIIIKVIPSGSNLTNNDAPDTGVPSYILKVISPE